MKSKDLQSRLLYAARLSFKIEGEIRSFSDKRKLKEFVNIDSTAIDVKGLALRRRKRDKRDQNSLTIKWY